MTSEPGSAPALPDDVDTDGHIGEAEEPADAASPTTGTLVPEKSGKPRSRRRRRIVRAALGVAACAAVALLVVIVTNAIVTRGATGLTYDDVAAVPNRTVAIVFGAGVVDGKPTPALSDRVHGSVELYKQGKVGHLLLTGDNSNKDYDEVSVMREQAMNEGVPASAITRDYAGFSTYDSCYRARDIFGVRDAVLVTQDYHLSRALYTCRDLGIDAVGLDIPDWQHNADRVPWGQYPRGLGMEYMAREWFARTKSVIAAKITHPSPTLLGPYVGLTET